MISICSSLRFALVGIGLASTLELNAQVGVFTDVQTDAVHFKNPGGNTPLGFEAWGNTINLRYQGGYFGSFNAANGAFSINGPMSVAGGMTFGNGVIDLINGDTSGGASDSAGIKAWNTIRLYSTCTGYTSNANYGIQFSPRDGGAVFKGNVGIGTATPASKLQVFASAGHSEVNIRTSAADAGNVPALSLSNPTITWSMALIDGNGFYIRENNANWTPRFSILNGGNVGVGTTSPAYKLEVAGAAALTFSSNEGPVLWLNNPAKVGNGARWALYNMTGGYGNSLQFWNYGPAGETPTSRMSLTDSGNLGLGIMNPTNKLEVNGTIRTKEVIVETTGWSDYVFAPDYRLAPLSEVEAAIKASGHLPGIPSAAEVAEHGVSLGDMQAKLLAKMEEMTLHQIEMSKQLNTAVSRIAQLEAENAALRTK